MGQLLMHLMYRDASSRASAAHRDQFVAKAHQINDMTGCIGRFRWDIR
jgi:hypothetical protein